MSQQRTERLILESNPILEGASGRPTTASNVQQSSRLHAASPSFIPRSLRERQNHPQRQLQPLRQVLGDLLQPRRRDRRRPHGAVPAGEVPRLPSGEEAERSERSRRLTFDPLGRAPAPPRGPKVEIENVFLLVSKALGERNYHIFYCVLAGITAEEKKALALGDPGEYKFLTKVTGGSVQQLRTESRLPGKPAAGLVHPLRGPRRRGSVSAHPLRDGAVLLGRPASRHSQAAGGHFAPGEHQLRGWALTRTSWRFVCGRKR